jgi:hypothetical protein
MKQSIELHFWHEGDPSVGIDGERAVVTIPCYDDANLQSVIESLSNAFSEIWDVSNKYIKVMTKEKLQKDTE